MITVIFQGGLGNQIFQLCLAIFLKQKGYSVILDASNYINERSYHEGLSIEKLFDLSAFEIKKAIYKKNKLIDKIKILLPIKLKIILSKYHSLLKSIFYMNTSAPLQIWDEKMFLRLKTSVLDYDFKSSINYSLKGYWQDEYIVNQVLGELKNLLLNQKITNFDHLELINSIKETNSVLIHFRGGDFLDKNNQKTFDILSGEYYQNSVNFFLETLTSPIFFVYYDDETQMKKMLPKNLPNIKIIGRLSSDAVYDFNVQMTHKYYLCSNSTFSWWTAKLSSERKIALIPERFTNEFKEDFQKVNHYTKLI